MIGGKHDRHKEAIRLKELQTTKKHILNHKEIPNLKVIQVIKSPHNNDNKGTSNHIRNNIQSTWCQPYNGVKWSRKIGNT